MRYFESEFVVNKELATRLVKEFFASFNPRNVMKLDGQSAKVKIFFEDAHQCGIVDVIGEASEIQKFTYNGDDEVQVISPKDENKEIQAEVAIEPKTAEPSEVKKSSKRSKRKSKAILLRLKILMNLVSTNLLPKGSILGLISLHKTVLEKNFSKILDMN